MKLSLRSNNFFQRSTRGQLAFQRHVVEKQKELNLFGFYCVFDLCLICICFCIWLITGANSLSVIGSHWPLCKTFETPVGQKLEARWWSANGWFGKERYGWYGMVRWYGWYAILHCTMVGLPCSGVTWYSFVQHGTIGTVCQTGFGVAWYVWAGRVGQYPMVWCGDGWWGQKWAESRLSKEAENSHATTPSTHNRWWSNPF